MHFKPCFRTVHLCLPLLRLEVLEKVKDWCIKTKDGYLNFLQANTSLYWIVDLTLQVTLNLPPEISDIYVADVTQCYESIPLHGEDNLLDAMTFILTKG